ncbi:hypothetical protein VXE32_000915 [Burkholderia cepacia]|nr:hypothetical protein [Burkholderia cepacia]
MLSTKLRTTRTRPERRQKWNWQSGLGFAKDLLDLVIKISLILLPLPALAIFLYLRALHRTDLFLPAILSGPGLVALLEATLVLCAALLASFVGPSWLASWMTSTYSKDSRPMPGTATYVLVVGLLAGPFYLALYYLSIAKWQVWLKWVAGISAGLLLVGILFALAWYSPRYFRMLTVSERTNKKQRIGKSLARTGIGLLSGAYTLSAVTTIYAFARSYQLPEDGWAANLIGSLIIFASLWPGAAFLLRRSRGESSQKSFWIASVAVLAPVLGLLLSGVSPQPLALVTMRAMSIWEKEPRTFQLVKETERSVWAALGFHFIGDSSFFPATIRFQFGDVRLLCVDGYDAAGPYPGALGPFSAKPAKSAVPETGCVTSLKDEVRVVELPTTGFVVPKEKRPAAPHTPRSDGSVASDRSLAGVAISK